MADLNSITTTVDDLNDVFVISRIEVQQAQMEVLDATMNRSATTDLHRERLFSCTVNRLCLDSKLTQNQSP